MPRRRTTVFSVGTWAGGAPGPRRSPEGLVAGAGRRRSPAPARAVSAVRRSRHVHPGPDASLTVRTDPGVPLGGVRLRRAACVASFGACRDHDRSSLRQPRPRGLPPPAGHRPRDRQVVTADNVLGLIVAGGLVVYLVICLLFPERF
ncbi:potassium-transporting ATPase subunit F [Streptomyces wadayamensis]|uniref:potassium-transporting ATPase subunit F n=1 Tax=Streptomyces wadayamensis TaxID=141454 RepID=UPI003D66AE5E